MGFMKKIKKRISKQAKGIKLPFKKKRRKKKGKKKRIIPPIPINTCCCAVIILVLLGGMFAFGGGGEMFAVWFSGGGGATTTETTTTTTTEPIDPPPDDDDEDDIYYQLGLVFPIRNEDIDVWMIVEVNTSDHLTFIESFGMGPFGLYKSANDYKPDDMFFLYMFYGDAEYNISFSTVVTVGGEQDITVYWNGVAIDEVVNVTWIANGSGVRWDYP